MAAEPMSTPNPRIAPSVEGSSAPAVEETAAPSAGDPAPPGQPERSDTSAERVWDVIVVGGGIGGLTVAALLAKAGRAVLLLERSTQLGGTCAAVTRDGHTYDVGVGVITGAGPGGAVAALCERLEITLPTTPCDPTVQLALPLHRLSFSRAVDGWWPEIHREFPEDEAGWHSLCSDLASLARDREELARHLPPLPPDGWRERLRCWSILTLRGFTPATGAMVRRVRRAAETPLPETLAVHGLAAASRQALEACLWYLLLHGAEECSTLEAALALERLREGVVSVSPGPAALVDALARQVRMHGGEIRLQTGPAHCIARRGRIAGVTTAAGGTLRARWVVSDVPPAILTADLLPNPPGRLRRRHPAHRSWQPRYVAQVLGVAIPQTYVPSELGGHCLIVRDAHRPARDENLVFIRKMPKGHEEGGDESVAHLSAGRFVPPSASEDERAVTQALLEALDQLIPGVEAVTTHRCVLPASVLGELWGRPLGAVRYEPESRTWLGRRGLAHDVGWPGLLAVGEWTYPGRLVSEVIEGAMDVVHRITVEE